MPGRTDDGGIGTAAQEVLDDIDDARRRGPKQWCFFVEVAGVIVDDGALEDERLDAVEVAVGCRYVERGARSVVFLIGLDYFSFDFGGHRSGSGEVWIRWGWIGGGVLFVCSKIFTREQVGLQTDVGSVDRWRRVFVAPKFSPVNKLNFKRM